MTKISEMLRRCSKGDDVCSGRNLCETRKIVSQGLNGKYYLQPHALKIWMRLPSHKKYFSLIFDKCTWMLPVDSLPSYGWAIFSDRLKEGFNPKVVWSTRGRSRRGFTLALNEAKQSAAIKSDFVQWCPCVFPSLFLLILKLFTVTTYAS